MMCGADHPRYPWFIQKDELYTSIKYVFFYFVLVTWSFHKMLLQHALNCWQRVVYSYLATLYVRVRQGLLGLGWLYSPSVLGLIRDKDHLLRGQVRLAWEK
jgi:hypothetical protein